MLPANLSDLAFESLLLTVCHRKYRGRKVKVSVALVKQANQAGLQEAGTGHCGKIKPTDSTLYRIVSVLTMMEVSSQRVCEIHSHGRCAV